MHARAFGFQANPSWDWLVPSWPLILGCFAFAKAIATTGLLNDPDTYLHIAAGRWMLSHLALPTADPFSHSMPGAPWVPHEWLAETIFAAAFEAGGWGAVRLITALSFAIALGISTRLLLRRFDPLPCVIVSAAAGWLLLPHLLARPHILALPLLVLWCGILIEARDSGRGPPLCVLPVMTLWANLHGGFMFGLALAGFLGSEAVLLPDAGQTRVAEARRWAGFIGLSIVAAMLTPNGLAGLLQPFRLVSMPMLPMLIEWRSANLDDFPALEAWLLGAIFLGFSYGFKLPLTRLLLTLGLFHLALQHVRHADLLALVVPLAVAAPLGTQIRERLRAVPTSTLSRHVERLAEPAALPGMLIAGLLMLFVGMAMVARPIDRSGDPATPAAALAAARSMSASGPVFNAYPFGGYLLFEDVPVLIDGRLEMYGDVFLARYLKASSGDEKTLAGMLDDFHIGWTMLQPQDGAVAVLDRLSGWRRAYADTQAVIHIRSRPAR
ncbi:MAG: hypothetical protein JO213_04770 [Alphaproteobacteria bacterium]|nr:hypothetical protein [Alphaproteobacteria bacterium]